MPPVNFHPNPSLTSTSKETPDEILSENRSIFKITGASLGVIASLGCMKPTIAFLLSKDFKHLIDNDPNQATAALLLFFTFAVMTATGLTLLGAAGGETLEAWINRVPIENQNENPV